MDTFLNDVKFKVGNIVTLTDEGITHLRPYVKGCDDYEDGAAHPTITKAGAEFEVTHTKESYAEDYLTELSDRTIGCTGLRNTKTGETFILDKHPKLWAFFTECTPHYFNLQE